jgi:hypothetical protein
MTDLNAQGAQLRSERTNLARSTLNSEANWDSDDTAHFWGGIGSTVGAATVAAAIATLNNWNPVGWIAGAIALGLTATAHGVAQNDAEDSEKEALEKLVAAYEASDGVLDFEAAIDELELDDKDLIKSLKENVD